MQAILGRAGLLAALLLGAAGAGAFEGRAHLSWRAEEIRRTLPAAPAGESYELPLFLTVETDAPLDSLGLILRWATAEAQGGVSIGGLEAAGPGSVAARYVAGDPRARAGRFSALGHWEGDRGFLEAARVASNTYRMQLAVTVSGSRAVQLAAARLAVRSSAGEVVRLGLPSVSVGDGWQLRLPPLVTDIAGFLNLRCVQSTITIRGVDLDRLVRLAVIDSTGTRIFPARIVSRSREQIDVAFTNKAAVLGLCDVEIGGPLGVRDTLVAAIEVALLVHPQPRDTNMGIIPGSDR